jgi:hypothetical protein
MCQAVSKINLDTNSQVTKYEWDTSWTSKNFSISNQLTKENNSNICHINI